MDRQFNTSIQDNYGDQLILDNHSNPTKIAIMSDGKLVEFLSVLPPNIPQIGSVHIARIQQVFKQHRLANALLEDGTHISVRMSDEKLQTGSLALVTITAEPWDTKPARAVLGAELAGRYVIVLPGKPEIRRVSKNSGLNKDSTSQQVDLTAAGLPDEFGIILRRQAADAQASSILNEIKNLITSWQDGADLSFKLDHISTPKKIYSGPTLFHSAGIIAPLANSKICIDDSEWQEIYDELDNAAKHRFITDQDVAIWFQPTEGLTAIDIDSAGSRLSLPQLMPHIGQTVLKQIRLRQISGAIFVDMPRLSKSDRIKFNQLCINYALADIRHPDIYGYGPAGLLEMTVRHRHMMLENRMKLLSSKA